MLIVNFKNLNQQLVYLVRGKGVQGRHIGGSREDSPVQDPVLFQVLPTCIVSCAKVKGN